MIFCPCSEAIGNENYGDFNQYRALHSQVRLIERVSALPASQAGAFKPMKTLLLHIMPTPTATFNFLF